MKMYKHKTKPGYVICIDEMVAEDVTCGLMVAHRLYDNYDFSELVEMDESEIRSGQHDEYIETAKGLMQHYKEWQGE